MSDLTPKQALVIWSLLGFQGRAPQKDVLPKVDRADREALVRMGLISSTKSGRSFLLEVEDRGWNWASEHLGGELPANLQVLRNWLARLREHLWIKKHPSPTGLLYVLDEAQTFLPSQKPALSVGSGIKLVAQARKYGLGMMLATQAPRGIHNQVVSNCTTQFFGRQSAPATIGAAQEIIAASGGKADDIGKLKAGEFYFRTEGWAKPGKVRTPICLSYHPPNPPTPEDVILRARRSRAPNTVPAS